MSLEALANLGELVSAVAVVVSLIYLAFQVRQSTQSLRIENHGRVLERVSAMQARLSSDPELSRIVNLGILDPASFSPAQRIQFSWAFYEMFGAFEFMYHQVQARALSEDVWARWSRTLAWWISMPGVQVWWRCKPTPFSAGFSAVVEALLRAGPPDVDAERQFEAFVSNGSAPPQ